MVTGKVQNVGECLSRLYFRCVSDRVRSVSPEPFNHYFGMAMYYHEIICHGKIGSLSSMSRSQRGLMTLCTHNMTISVVSSKLLVRLQPNLI